MDILVKIGLFGQNWTFWSKLDFLLKNSHFGEKWTYKANIWSFCSKLDIWVTFRHFSQNQIFCQKWTFFKTGVGGRGQGSGQGSKKFIFQFSIFFRPKSKKKWGYGGPLISSNFRYFRSNQIVKSILKYIWSVAENWLSNPLAEKFLNSKFLLFVPKF